MGRKPKQTKKKSKYSSLSDVVSMSVETVIGHSDQYKIFYEYKEGSHISSASYYLGRRCTDKNFALMVMNYFLYHQFTHDQIQGFFLSNF